MVSYGVVFPGIGIALYGIVFGMMWYYTVGYGNSFYSHNTISIYNIQ